MKPKGYAMTRRATLRIEAKLGNPMEPMCVHVCTDEGLIAIVSLEDFDNTCETLSRVRHDRIIKQDVED
jgi:hypothetical protein